MAPIAVIADVHGNRSALEAVLRAIRGAGACEIWCLGDLVGYGADPGWCVSTCLRECSRVVAGNHDLGAAGTVPLRAFSTLAHDAMRWTREVLTDAEVERLRALAPQDADAPVPIFHASPRDPVWEYVVTPDVALDCLRLVDAPVVLTGHTHLPAAWRLTPEGELDGGFVEGEGRLALREGRWLVNPGSVGQPRDGDARAAWMLYDPDAHLVTFRRTPYDVAAAQNAILQAGLPSALASRLSDGR